MNSELEQLEQRLTNLEEKIRELEKQFKMLMSGNSILLESYGKVEQYLSKLCRSLELSTPAPALVSPLHLIELQQRSQENRNNSKSKTDLLLEKAVSSIFSDYERQMEGS
ncbi:MAG: hypothetical protein ACPL1I_09895 [bacterium]